MLKTSLAFAKTNRETCPRMTIAVYCFTDCRIARVTIPHETLVTIEVHNIFLKALIACDNLHHMVHTMIHNSSCL